MDFAGSGGGQAQVANTTYSLYPVVTATPSSMFPLDADLGGGRVIDLGPDLASDAARTEGRSVALPLTVGLSAGT